MRITEIYDITDKYGDQEIFKQSNGIIVKINVNPSVWYQTILDARAGVTIGASEIKKI